MYAKIENNEIVKCPYTIDDLRKDNPNISFPEKISDNLLSEHGVVNVFVNNKPQIGYDKNIIQKNPAFNLEKNRWEISWIVTDATSNEIAERTSNQSADVRAERDAKLAETDWTQVLDSPVDRTAWSNYRQALRDVPQQQGFPWSVSWPVKP